MLQDQRLSSPLLISPEGEGNEKLRRTKMTTLSGGIITTIITDHTNYFLLPQAFSIQQFSQLSPSYLQDLFIQ